MITQLLLYLLMLVIGAFIGFYNLHHRKLDQVLGKLQVVALLFILFVMGIRLGADREVTGAIGEIGFQALMIALGSVIFSVLFVFIGRKLWKLVRGGIK